MVKRIFFIESDTFNPYKNLAIEEYLMIHVPEDAIILYLWQNENAVVIGQNQNPFTQCNLRNFRKYKANMARRLSGGGAVYHDKGNLNYTFVAQRKNFSIYKNIEIVLSLLDFFCVQAEKNGRNDIEYCKRKISGNAFYNKGECCFHHGTILVDCNLIKMQEILTVDPQKWSNKGIESVRSRVVNISEINHSITVDKIKKQFKNFFRKTYADASIDKLYINEKEIEKLQQKYQSEEWIWGKDIPCSLEIQDRFVWGDFCACIGVEGDVIKDARIYSDSLVVEIFPKIAQALEGRKWNKNDVKNALLMIETENNEIIGDIVRLLIEHM